MLKKSFFNSQKLPLVIESDAPDKSLDALFELTSSERNLLREQLLEYGALLFRGFDVQTVQDFEAFVKHFSGREFFNYAGGVSPRLSLSNGVYTSTEYPPDLTLGLHNELSYSKNYPRHVYFYCATEPQTGGETTLGDSRRILRNIAPEIVELFRNKQVRYDRCLQNDENSDYSWQAAFETTDKKDVEDYCIKIGADFAWQENGSLRVSQIRPATAQHPETGAEVWFNQADGFHPSNLDAETRNYFTSRRENFRLNSFFGDGEPIAAAALEHIRAVLQNETVPHRWRANDVLILDNMLTAHGRMPFAGARKIALAMT